MLLAPRSVLGTPLILALSTGFRVLPSDTLHAQTRDSAGVMIVENTQARWPDGGGWHVSGEPVVSIGTVNGPEQYTFYRVTGSVILRDGRILVANSGTRELRVYDRSGAFLRSVGGEGGGPGEFGRLTFLRRVTDDTVMVWDHDLRRVSVFDDQPSFVRSYSPSPLQGQPLLVGDFVPLTDGSALFATFRLRSAQATARLGLSRDTTLLLRCDGEGELIDTVAVFSGGEFYTSEEYPRIEVPFARGSFVRGYGAGFYLGDNARYEISFHRANGSRTRIVRKEHSLVPVSRRAVEREKLAGLEDVASSEMRQRFERMMEPVKGPPTMPTFSRLLVDAEGNLWVQEYQLSDDDGPAWTVFNPEGVMLGSVSLPTRFTVHEVGSDYVLGRWRDEMDAEYVQLYALMKP